MSSLGVIVWKLKILTNPLKIDEFIKNQGFNRLIGKLVRIFDELLYTYVLILVKIG